MPNTENTTSRGCRCLSSRSSTSAPAGSTSRRGLAIFAMPLSDESLRVRRISSQKAIISFTGAA